MKKPRRRRVPDRVVAFLPHRDCLVFGAVFILFAILYLTTMCPTVYWGDGAEYTITSYTLRNAHPSGYPLFSLIGKAFTLLPLGNVAWRVNLLSAAAVLSSLLLILSVFRRFTTGWALPLLGVATIGVSRSWWSLAASAETLSLNLFFLSLLLWLATMEDPPWLTVAFLAGLGATNHQQVVLFWPALLFLFLSRERQVGQKVFAQGLLILSFLLLGLSVYLFLWVRSGYPYPQNYPEADSFRGLWEYLSRSMYTGPTRLRTVEEAFSLLGPILLSFPREVGWPLVLLSPLGAAWPRSGSRGRRALGPALLLTAFLTILSALFNGPVGTTYKLSLYTVQAYWAIAILGVFGACRLAAWEPWKGTGRRVPALAVTAALTVQGVVILQRNLPFNNLSGHHYAFDWGRLNLDTIGRGAVYLTAGDNPANLSHYQLIVRGYRRDVSAIPQEGLLSDSYNRKLMDILPGLAFPEGFTTMSRWATPGDWGENSALLGRMMTEWAALNPGRPFHVYPALPEALRVPPRTPAGINYLLRDARGEPEPQTNVVEAAWAAYEDNLAKEAPPFLFDDFVLPDLAGIHQRFGFRYYLLGDIPGARGEYERSLGLTPGHAGTRLNAARFFQATGHWEKAEYLVEQVLEADPVNSEALSMERAIGRSKGTR